MARRSAGRKGSQGFANLDLGLSDDDSAPPDGNTSRDGSRKASKTSIASDDRRSSKGSVTAGPGGRRSSESISDLLSGKDSAMLFGNAPSSRMGRPVFGNSSAGGDPLDFLAKEVAQRAKATPAVSSQPVDDADEEELRFQQELQRELGMAGIGGDDGIVAPAPEANKPDDPPPTDSPPAPQDAASEESMGSLDDIMGDILGEDDGKRRTSASSTARDISMIEAQSQPVREAGGDGIVAPAPEANKPYDPPPRDSPPAPQDAASEESSGSLDDIMGDILGEDDAKPRASASSRARDISMIEARSQPVLEAGGRPRPQPITTASSDLDSRSTTPAGSGAALDTAGPSGPNQAPFDVELNIGPKPKRRMGKAKAKPSSPAHESELAIEKRNSDIGPSGAPELRNASQSGYSGAASNNVGAKEVHHEVPAASPQSAVKDAASASESDWDASGDEAAQAEEQGEGEDAEGVVAQVAEAGLEHMNAEVLGDKQTTSPSELPASEPVTAGRVEEQVRPEPTPPTADDAVDAAVRPPSTALRYDNDTARPSAAVEAPLDVELNVGPKPKRRLGQPKAKPTSPPAEPELTNKKDITDVGVCEEPKLGDVSQCGSTATASHAISDKEAPIDIPTPNSQTDDKNAASASESDWDANEGEDSELEAQAAGEHMNAESKVSDQSVALSAAPASEDMDGSRIKEHVHPEPMPPASDVDAVVQPASTPKADDKDAPKPPDPVEAPFDVELNVGPKPKRRLGKPEAKPSLQAAESALASEQNNSDVGLGEEPDGIIGTAPQGLSMNELHRDVPAASFQTDEQDAASAPESDWDTNDGEDAEEEEAEGADERLDAESHSNNQSAELSVVPGSEPLSDSKVEDHECPAPVSTASDVAVEVDAQPPSPFVTEAKDTPKPSDPVEAPLDVELNVGPKPKRRLGKANAKASTSSDEPELESQKENVDVGLGEEPEPDNAPEGDSTATAAHDIESKELHHDDPEAHPQTNEKEAASASESDWDSNDGDGEEVEAEAAGKQLDAESQMHNESIALSVVPASEPVESSTVADHVCPEPVPPTSDEAADADAQPPSTAKAEDKDTPNSSEPFAAPLDVELNVGPKPKRRLGKAKAKASASSDEPELESQKENADVGLGDGPEQKDASQGGSTGTASHDIASKELHHDVPEADPKTNEENAASAPESDWDSNDGEDAEEEAEGAGKHLDAESQMHNQSVDLSAVPASEPMDSSTVADHVCLESVPLTSDEAADAVRQTAGTAKADDNETARPDPVAAPLDVELNVGPKPKRRLGKAKAKASSQPQGPELAHQKENFEVGRGEEAELGNAPQGGSTSTASQAISTEEVPHEMPVANIEADEKVAASASGSDWDSNDAEDAPLEPEGAVGHMDAEGQVNDQSTSSSAVPGSQTRNDSRLEDRVDTAPHVPSSGDQDSPAVPAVHGRAIEGDDEEAYDEDTPFDSDDASTPPDKSASTPPDKSASTPPDKSASTPPDKSGSTPPDKSASPPPDESASKGQSDKTPGTPEQAVAAECQTIVANKDGPGSSVPHDSGTSSVNDNDLCEAASGPLGEHKGESGQIVETTTAASDLRQGADTAASPSESEEQAGESGQFTEAMKTAAELHPEVETAPSPSEPEDREGPDPLSELSRTLHMALPCKVSSGDEELQKLKQKMLEMEDLIHQQGSELERFRHLSPKETEERVLEEIDAADGDRQIQQDRHLSPKETDGRLLEKIDAADGDRQIQQETDGRVLEEIDAADGDCQIQQDARANNEASPCATASASVPSAPPAPPPPHIEAVSSTSVLISWSWSAEDGASDVAAYALVVHDDTLRYYDACSGTLVVSPDGAAPLSASARSVLIEGIVAGGCCKAEIAVMNEVGWSQHSIPSKVVSLAPPEPPPQPSLEVVDAQSLRVSWAAVSPAIPVLGYSVTIFDGTALQYIDIRSGNLAVDGAGLPAVPAEMTTVVVQSLSTRKGHAAAVAARTKLGWGKYSTFSETLAIDVPTQPLQPTITAIDGVSVRVSWELLNSVPQVMGYGLRIAAGGGAFMYFDARSGRLVGDSQGACPIAAEDASVVINGLEARVCYKAKVAALNEVGWSRYSASSDAITLDAPRAPEGLAMRLLGLDSVCVEWAPVAHAYPPVSNFAISFKVDGSLMYYDARSEALVSEPDRALSLPGDALTAVVKSLRRDVKYTARIASKNDVGWSRYSLYCKPTTIEIPDLPLAPRLEVLNESSLRASWPAASLMCALTRQGVTGYALVVCDDSLTYYDVRERALVSCHEGLPPVPADVTSVTVQGLSAGVQYRAKVAMRNAAGWGKYSAYSETLQILEPPSPAAPAVRAVESGSIRVSWDPVKHLPSVTGYLIAVYDGIVLRYWSSLDGKLYSHVSDAAPAISPTMSVGVNGLEPGSWCKVKVAAVNAVGSSIYSSFSEEVLVEESDDMRLWPSLRLDLAPGVPSPRTWQSSQFAYIAGQSDSVDLSVLHALFASLPSGLGVQPEMLLDVQDIGERERLLVSAWLCCESLHSPLFILLNQVLLEDDEDQLASWAPALQLFLSFVAARPLCRAWTAWRGSRLTRMQAHSLRVGEIIRPPMFVSASEGKHLAEVFQDIYLVRLDVPSHCRWAGMVGKRRGCEELVLSPYTPLRIKAIRADDVIEVEVVDFCDAEVDSARAFPI